MDDMNRSAVSLSAMKDAWLRRKWWLSGLFLLTLCVGTALVLSLPDLYRSSTKLLVGQNAITGSMVGSGGGVPLDQRLYSVEQQLLSRDRLLGLIEQYDLYPGLRDEVPETSLISRIRRDIAINLVPTVQTAAQRGEPAPIEVVIGYQGWEPDLVADIANRLGEDFQDIYESVRFGQANRTTAFLREQLDELEERMLRQEQQVKDFRMEHLGRLPQQLGVNLSTLGRLNQDLRLNGERQVQLIERQMESAGATSEAGASAAMSEAARLDFLRRERRMMSARMNERHPDMLRLQERIEQLEESVQNEPQTDRVELLSVENGAPMLGMGDLSQLMEEERQIRSAIDLLQQQIELVPAIEQDLNKLENDYAVTREQRLALQRRYEEARLSESMERQQNQGSQVLEPARPAVLASAPSRQRLLIMVVIAGLGMTAALVYLSALSYKGFSHASDLGRFTSVPVLASITRMRTASERVRSGLFSALAFLFFVMILLVSSTVIYQGGQSARGVVWIIAGDNR